MYFLSVKYIFVEETRVHNLIYYLPKYSVTKCSTVDTSYVDTFERLDNTNFLYPKNNKDS